VNRIARKEAANGHRNEANEWRKVRLLRERTSRSLSSESSKMIRAVASMLAIRGSKGSDALLVSRRSKFMSTGITAPSLMVVLKRVRDGTMEVEEASELLQKASLTSTNDELLRSFANLDHGRAWRTGWPEAVFAEGKTPTQVAIILDDMARSVNERLKDVERGDENYLGEKTILATRFVSQIISRCALRFCALVSTLLLALCHIIARVTPGMFHELTTYRFQHGSVEYNSTARIVFMRASTVNDSARHPSGAANRPTPPQLPRVVVVTAGTTDIPIAEEAAVTLETAGCCVDRVYDAGVAGLHRILRQLPVLAHADVGCVIVAAGMDGALPSVVGGLVSAPVIAVPTSIGYGASFGGLSAMLTMMNR
jgi:pyridinium-3,5-biscarboxylic acid mononucleotide synthase